ncbi:MAG: hypothetical protein IJW50_08840 [Clostridia bacterium]|nr:hypothetical protein [Clostridia bacterium]
MTNRMQKWYNINTVRKDGDRNRGVSLVKNLKKVEKTFKKGIDKRERMWYNIKAVAKVAANGH